MQFRVTGLYSYIHHGSTTYTLNPGDTVRLTIGSDSKGKLYATSSTINTFYFNNVGLSINGANNGTANIPENSGIWISNYDSYTSTLTVDVPSKNAWTSLTVDGATIISGDNSSHIRIIGLAAFPSPYELNVDITTGSKTDCYGGAASYTLT